MTAALHCSGGPTATAEQRALASTSAELASFLQTHHEVLVGMASAGSAAGSQSGHSGSSRRSSVPSKSQSAVSASAAARAGVTWGDDVEAASPLTPSGGLAAGSAAQAVKLRRMSLGAGLAAQAEGSADRGLDSVRSRRASLPAHLARTVESFGSSRGSAAAAAAAAVDGSSAPTTPASLGPRSSSGTHHTSPASPRSPVRPARASSGPRQSVASHLSPAPSPAGEASPGEAAFGRRVFARAMSLDPSPREAPLPAHLGRMQSDGARHLAPGAHAEKGGHAVLPSLSPPVKGAHHTGGHAVGEPAAAAAASDSRAASAARALLSPEQALTLRLSKAAGAHLPSAASGVPAAAQGSVRAPARGLLPGSFGSAGGRPSLGFAVSGGGAAEWAQPVAAASLRGSDIPAASHVTRRAASVAPPSGPAAPATPAGAHSPAPPAAAAAHRTRSVTLPSDGGRKLAPNAGHTFDQLGKVLGDAPAKAGH